MKQLLALVLALLAWAVIRARILLNYWIAYPAELALVVASPATVPLVWWLAQDGYLGDLGIPAAAIATAMSLFTALRIADQQYEYAVDLLKHPDLPDEASR